MLAHHVHNFAQTLTILGALPESMRKSITKVTAET